VSNEPSISVDASARAEPAEPACERAVFFFVRERCFAESKSRRPIVLVDALGVTSPLRAESQRSSLRVGDAMAVFIHALVVAGRKKPRIPKRYGIGNKFRLG
jgi:hypothetical protein